MSSSERRGKRAESREKREERSEKREPPGALGVVSARHGQCDVPALLFTP